MKEQLFSSEKGVGEKEPLSYPTISQQEIANNKAQGDQFIHKLENNNAIIAPNGDICLDFKIIRNENTYNYNVYPKQYNGIYFSLKFSESIPKGEAVARILQSRGYDISIKGQIYNNSEYTIVFNDFTESPLRSGFAQYSIVINDTAEVYPLSKGVTEIHTTFQTDTDKEKDLPENDNLNKELVETITNDLEIPIVIIKDITEEDKDLLYKYGQEEIIGKSAENK